MTTASMNEAGKSAWCREHGVYPAELEKWRTSCTAALADEWSKLLAIVAWVQAHPRPGIYRKRLGAAP